MLAVARGPTRTKTARCRPRRSKPEQNRLKTLDRDKDGKLTAEEIGWPPQFGGRGGRGGRGGFGRGGRGAPRHRRKSSPSGS